jgi:hypothetical protein
MPDRWELANGTNPYVPDADADPDHDGMSNLQEYLAGTCPTNAASVLRLEVVSATQNNFIFAFSAVSNHSYTIQNQPALGGTWRKVRDVTAVSTNRTIWQTNSMAGDANCFFRLVTPLIGPADSDGDGLPDEWEIANGTDPYMPDADADPDHDGMSNYQEMLAGTSPTNAASVFRFETVSLTGTNLALSFLAVSNHSYTVQSCSFPTEGPWENWINIPAVATNRTLWLTNAVSAGTNRFFRLVTPQQL